MANELPKHFGASTSKHRRKICISDFQTEDIERLFNKTMCFQNNSDSLWSLPDVDSLFEEETWNISELQEMKEDLNAVKSKLNNYDLDEWHKHTSATNVAGDILWKLKNEIKVEFPTQAWCKFYEIAMTFPLLSMEAKEKQCLNSFHLCEAPGAFITSLNHFLKSHHPEIKWSWRATTLNPYYEGNQLSSMINDDRFILQTLPYWTFGCDYTGDIMNLQNVEYLVNDILNFGEISLITADGSIDCHDNPGEQEKVLSQLHYFETIASLKILSDGGCFVLKMFTFFEAQSVCLLYLLCCAFSKVHVFKPVTSKEGNSEVYIICLEYKGKQLIDPWLKKIFEAVGTKQTNKVMFSLKSFPENFINQLLTCSRKFKDLQVDVVERNIKLYGNVSQELLTKRKRYLTARYFMEHYKVSTLLDNTKEVVGHSKLKNAVALNLDYYLEGGSFHEKTGKKCLHWKEKIHHISSALQDIEVLWTFHCIVKWFRSTSSSIKYNKITGKPINVVCSSKFCSRRLLKVWNQFREVIKEVPNSFIDRNFPNDFPIECYLQMVRESVSMEANLRVIDFESVYGKFVTCTSNNKLEKKCFINIVNTVSCMLCDENLLLINYPLFTQFNVGVVYILSHLFAKVGFVKPTSRKTSIIFIRFLNSKESTVSILKEFREMCVELESSIQEKSVLSLVCIDVLCGMDSMLDVNESSIEMKKQREDEITSLESSSAFYSCVTETNNMYLKDNISRVIQELM